MIICDPGLCNDCGICIYRCPKDALKLVDADTPVPTVAAATAANNGHSQGGWGPALVREIQQKAASATYPIRGLGTNRKLATFDDLLVLPAGMSRMAFDTYREKCNTTTVLGKRFASRPVVLDTPLMIGAMSYGALSKEAMIALAKGSAAVGAAISDGVGGLLQEQRDASYIQFTQISPSRYAFSLRTLELADALEIVYGIGAKPGLSGHLLGAKVSAEIAEFRQVPRGIDLYSHPRHGDIFGADDLMVKLEELREITNGEKPIFVKLGAGRVREDVKILAKVGVDGIIIDGMQGGTGAGPIIALDHLGTPILPAVVSATRALEEMGLKEEVSLIVSGGIRNGADVAKALALGADAVGLGTGPMIAMGCTACEECHKGTCHVGIATQNPKLRALLNIDTAAQQVANYLTAMTNELVLLTKAAGHSDVHSLEREDLRSLTLEACAQTGIPMVGTDFTFSEPFGFFG